MYTTECKLGKIVKVEGLTVLIEVTEKNIADKVSINMGICNFPVSINKFLFAMLPTGKRIIARISKIIDRRLFEEVNISFKSNADMILIEAELSGIYDDFTNKFDDGINNFPIIGSEVFALDYKFYEKLYNGDSEYMLQIGNSFLDSNINIYADPDILFGKHLGVFGNTGTGKTCTVVSLLQSLKKITKRCDNSNVCISPKIIIWDANDEYTCAFDSMGYRVKVINKEQLNLPHYNLSFTEYYKFLGASQGVQAPVLKETINKLKDDDGAFNFADLPTEMDNIIREKANGNNFNYNQWYGWISTLLNRINKIVEDERIINIIDSDAETDTVAEIMDSDDEIIIINSDFDKDELDIVMYIFSKLLLKYASDKRNNDEKCNMLVLFEEAHRYICEDYNEDYMLGNYYIERLAREGRKFGIGLIISSQRPSELSKTVLSQCNSYIVHRITNKNDLEFINKLLSISNQNLLKYVSGLEKQYAITVGEAFSYSDIVKINTANPRPRSNDPEVIKYWSEQFDAQLLS